MNFSCDKNLMFLVNSHKHYIQIFYAILHGTNQRKNMNQVNKENQILQSQAYSKPRN
jgi:hypothetical protein